VAVIEVTGDNSYVADFSKCAKTNFTIRCSQVVNRYVQFKSIHRPFDARANAYKSLAGGTALLIHSTK